MTDTRTRIGFSYGKGLGGLFSRVIMAITGAPCSHTWLLYYDADFESEMVMEAHTEWRLIPFDDFKKKNHIVEIREPIKNIDKGLVLGGRLLGSYYDVGGLLGNFFVIVGEWIQRKWKNPFRSSRMVFCSEGVARVMKYAGYHGLDSPNEVRPEHILALLRTDGSKVWPR
jgi:hypothetical protein